MIEKVILLFAAMFSFCLILFFCFICLVTYGLMHDKIVDIIIEVKSWFKEKLK